MKRCYTCQRELKPNTSVMRIGENALEATVRFRDEQAARRLQEIAEGKLGYLGEAEFCNKECAAFFVFRGTDSAVQRATTW